MLIVAFVAQSRLVRELQEQRQRDRAGSGRMEAAERGQRKVQVQQADTELDAVADDEVVPTASPHGVASRRIATTEALPRSSAQVMSTQLGRCQAQPMPNSADIQLSSDELSSA